MSPYSINWDCRLASWSQTAANYPNQCTYPQQNSGPSSVSLFGQCQFANVSQRELSLADEVLSAVKGSTSSLPRQNNVLQVGLAGSFYCYIGKIIDCKVVISC